MVEVGYRVVRGPDWCWGDQDGQDGHLGTVVKIALCKDGDIPERTVIVQWDNGTRTNYRVGFKGSYDLLVFDSAPAGVKHTNKTCDGCKKLGIDGIRWQCVECDGYNLCTTCYMGNKHSLEHTFIRYLHPSCKGIAVPKRSKHNKTVSHGIFPGARVVRGADWLWGEQDGKNYGTVVEIRGWDNESSNSVATVKWQGTKHENIYRVGHKGKMDLKCIKPASGQFFYKDHLPICGKDGDENMEKLTATLSKFKVGEKVKVSLDVDVLMKLQQGHGGWNPKMSQLIGKVGTIHRITQSGDVRVQYRSPENERSETNRWTFHPNALIKVTDHHDFAIDDFVQVISDSAKVRTLQSQEHGNWHEKMNEVIGKVGKVVEVYADGDVRVKFESQRIWTLNNACVLPVDKEFQTACVAPAQVEPSAPALVVLPKNKQLITNNVLSTPLINKDSIAKDLVHESTKGNLEKVKRIISLHPNTVNMKHNNTTALHVSSHEGHVSIIRFLLSHGADAIAHDNHNATPLHYAAHGKRSKCVSFLLDNGAEVDAKNHEGVTALHTSARLGDYESLQLLLQAKSNVNLKTNNGETAGHLVVAGSCHECAIIIFTHPEFDPHIVNGRKFNVFHEAAKKGEARMVDILLDKFPSIINLPKNDGFTALHLAALNGHYALIKLLLHKGQCDVNSTDNENQTPLHVAASQGDVNIVSLLVKEKASVKIPTARGNTCLHAALSAIPAHLSKTDVLTTTDFKECFNDNKCFDELKPILKACVGRYPKKVFKLVMVGCCLVYNGASLRWLNEDELSPLDLVEIQEIERILKSVKILKHNRTFDKTSTVANVIPKQHLSGHLQENWNFECAEIGNDSEDTPCISCDQDHPLVTFHPCKHKVVCVECSRRMRRCMKCHSSIEMKIAISGDIIDLRPDDESSTVIKLKQKVQELEESNQCSICMERERDVALQCGHRFCSSCPSTLRDSLCPICRRPIIDTIKLY